MGSDTRMDRTAQNAEAITVSPVVDKWTDGLLKFLKAHVFGYQRGA